MKILITEKLSQHKYKTPEGYLICCDAILARTGKQEYRRSEIFGDDCKDSEDIIEIDRPEEEVFDSKTLASFENKPITVEHPSEEVNVHNYSDYAVGYVRDVRRGIVDGQDVMLGNLVITDAQTIEEIENGEHTDLSCGYDCDIEDVANPEQKHIRGNHVALCQEGRAGIARIVDSKDSMITDTYLEEGKTYTSKSGHKLKITHIKSWMSDYNGEAIIEINYDYKKTDGKSGSSKCNNHDFYRMLHDSKGDNNMRRTKDGSLVEPSKAAINEFKDKLKRLGFKIVGEGKTIFDNIHFQIITTSGNKDENDLKQYAKQLSNVCHEIERKYHAPATYNVGLQTDGYISAGLDLHEMYVEDSVDDASPVDISIVDVENYVKNANGVLFARKKGERDLLSIAYCSEDGKIWYAAYKDKKSGNAGTRTQVGKTIFRPHQSPIGSPSIGRNVLTYCAANGLHKLPFGKQIDHKNEDYTDDNLSNLQLMNGTENRKKSREFRMARYNDDFDDDYEIRNVHGHYEVYKNGKFLTSEDTYSEAEKAIDKDNKVNDAKIFKDGNVFKSIGRFDKLLENNASERYDISTWKNSRTNEYTIMIYNLNDLSHSEIMNIARNVKVAFENYDYISLKSTNKHELEKIGAKINPNVKGFHISDSEIKDSKLNIQKLKQVLHKLSNQQIVAFNNKHWDEETVFENGKFNLYEHNEDEPYNSMNRQQFEDLIVDTIYEAFDRLSNDEDIAKAIAKELHIQPNAVLDAKVKDEDAYVLKLVKKTNAYDEYVVRCYKNGVYYEAGSYYSDDWDDAVGTIKMLAKQMHLTVKQSGNKYVADSTNISQLIKIAEIAKNFVKKSK